MIETIDIKVLKKSITTIDSTNNDLIAVNIYTQEGVKVADHYNIYQLPRVGEYIHLPEGQIESGYHKVLTIYYEHVILLGINIIIDKTGYKRRRDLFEAINNG